MKTKNVNNNVEDSTGKYRLVGTINLFDVVPEFVIPVFENEGVFFTQAKTNPLKIEAFDFLLNPQMIRFIQPIHEFDNLIMPNKKFDYVEGDDAIIGYQDSEKELFLGDFEDFKKYINGKEITDDFMSIEIPHYIKTLSNIKRG